MASLYCEKSLLPWDEKHDYWKERLIRRPRIFQCLDFWHTLTEGCLLGKLTLSTLSEGYGVGLGTHQVGTSGRRFLSIKVIWSIWKHYGTELSQRLWVKFLPSGFIFAQPTYHYIQHCHAVG
uniref:Uncharacterized protein n=1 Tax=Bionectria ochroleuca TaxID=29856 RepID=A0A8H7KBG1_BIOOC